MANTSRTKAKNRPSLKSQGAGYSTTNRKGETTYYKSAKDAPGYSDSRDGKNVAVSSGKPLSRVDAMGNTITSATLKQDAPIQFPDKPKVDGMFGIIDQNNANLSSISGGTYDAKTKQMTPATSDELFKSYLNANATAYADQTTSEDLLKEQQKYLKPKETLVNSLQGQINSITARRDAQSLSLEGQGRGQTDSFVGGEQARISREASIQALPIQAQLATAQDDLDSARSYASQLFQAQSQDAQARYQYQRDLNSSIYGYLDGKEKLRMAQLEKEQDRKFTVEQTNRSTLKQIALQAIEYGQGALAGEIMKFDPQSPTYDDDVADAMRRLRKPVADTGTGIYTNTQLKAITKLNEDISKNTTYAKTASMRGYIDNVKGALAQGNGISDIAGINQFQKVIDEGAVTRDQDVTLIKNAQSLSNQLQTKIKGLESGDQLSPDLRNQMSTLMDSLYKTQVQALQKDPYISAKTREAGLYGLTTEDTILNDISSISPDANQQNQMGPIQPTKDYTAETSNIQFKDEGGGFFKTVGNIWKNLFN